MLDIQRLVGSIVTSKRGRTKKDRDVSSLQKWIRLFEAFLPGNGQVPDFGTVSSLIIP